MTKRDAYEALLRGETLSLDVIDEFSGLAVLWIVERLRVDNFDLVSDRHAAVLRSVRR